MKLNENTIEELHQEILSLEKQYPDGFLDFLTEIGIEGSDLKLPPVTSKGLPSISVEDNPRATLLLLANTWFEDFISLRNAELQAIFEIAFIYGYLFKKSRDAES